MGSFIYVIKLHNTLLTSTIFVYWYFDIKYIYLSLSLNDINQAFLSFKCGNLCHGLECQGAIRFAIVRQLFITKKYHVPNVAVTFKKSEMKKPASLHRMNTNEDKLVRKKSKPVSALFFICITEKMNLLPQQNVLLI